MPLYCEEECAAFRAFRLNQESHIDLEVSGARVAFPADYWLHPIRRDGQVVSSVEKQPAIPIYHGGQAIEIVRDTPGQPADAFQFLGCWS
jgi:hypothetical protein